MIFKIEHLKIGKRKLFSFFLLIPTLFLITFLPSCQNQENGSYKDLVNNPEYYHKSLKKLTDVIVHDIFSPPVASRIYAYPNIAAYEVLVNGNSDYQSMAGQLKGLTEVPKPVVGEEISHPVASLHAFLIIGKALVFSEEKIEAYQSELYEELKNAGIPETIYDASMAYGEVVAKHILAWINEDNYKQTRTFPKFTVNDDKGRWQPTPPDYMEGIEPHWNQIRPFIIDSATQFIPAKPTAFDLNKDSDFYREMMEVYETVNQLSEEQTEIAKFWDCNPFVSHHQGHVMFATKKITPGGHWMGITLIASRKANLNLIETCEAYTRVSISLADAFISCWDEKYRSNLIRPETVINQTVDEDWVPLLQTPPFPEYTSGHSVISGSAAVTLTELLGDNFAFLDSTEVEYGLTARHFDSFYDASEEAALSRLYGGIHYMPAIRNGVDQGKKVGHFIAKKLVTKKLENTSVQ
ncbi:MAG: vanadium-dependent haloperoxidase [Flammeovirgaceae bacterium]|nr:vanadium-dependent haloperoxidase [Flammeovirgaceae bacterium]